MGRLEERAEVGLKPQHSLTVVGRLVCYNPFRKGKTSQTSKVEEEGPLAHVSLREGEEPEALLKRFQTSMQRSGILRELRDRRFFRSKGEQTRLDKQRSLRRIRRRRRR